MMVAVAIAAFPKVQAADAPARPPLTSQGQQAWSKVVNDGDYAGIARAYSDYMIAYGRDRYGKVHSPLFMTVLNRKTGKPL